MSDVRLDQRNAMTIRCHTHTSLLLFFGQMQIADLSFTLEEDEVEQVNPQHCLRCFNCSSSTSKLQQLNINLDSDGQSEAHLASFLFCTISSMIHDCLARHDSLA